MKIKINNIEASGITTLTPTVSNKNALRKVKYICPARISLFFKPDLLCRAANLIAVPRGIPLSAFVNVVMEAKKTAFFSVNVPLYNNTELRNTIELKNMIAQDARIAAVMENNLIWFITVPYL